MAAKAQPTILKQFFEGHRRKAFLVQWIQHCNRAGVSTIKLDMRLPLLNQSLIGMNDERLENRSASWRRMVPRRSDRRLMSRSKA